MKPIKETDKAIALNASITTRKRSKENNFVELIWIPKSQIFDNKVSVWLINRKIDELRDCFSANTEIIIKLLDADNDEIETILTDEQAKRNQEHEAKLNHLFQMGRLKHDALYTQAKQLGIKGVRKDMKTTTIEKLISQWKKQ